MDLPRIGHKFSPLNLARTQVSQSANPAPSPNGLVQHFYLTESVFKIVLQKSIPAQIRQLVLHIGNNQGCVDGFVRE